MSEDGLITFVRGPVKFNSNSNSWSMNSEAFGSSSRIFGSTKHITGLSVYCGGKYFALRSASVQLALGAVSVCNLSVICEIDASRLGTTINPEELSITTENIEHIADNFKYGSRAVVYQHSDRGRAILFDGYVADVGSTITSTVSSFGFSCDVVLQSAAAMYSNHHQHQGAAYISLGKAGGDTFVGLTAAIVPKAKNAENKKSLLEITSPFNPAKFAAGIIDNLTDVTQTDAGELKDSKREYDKLSSFINLAHAPTMTLAMNTAGNWNFNKDTRFLAKVSAADIVKQLQSSPGLTVFNNYIGQFGLVLAPRIGIRTRSGVPALDVIPDIGVNSDESFSIKPDEVLGYQMQSPRKELGEYHAIAVRTTPDDHSSLARGSSVASTVLWVGGYDEDGSPKLLKGVKYSATPNDKNSNLISRLGPVTIVPLPTWLTQISPTKGSDDSRSELWERYANALSKTYYAKGFVAPAQLSVTVLYTKLIQYYNHIGDVAEIDLSSKQQGYGTRQDAPLYGRLIHVNYRVNAEATSFSASCVLGFDCVCDQQEHATFGVSCEEMLCSNGK